jgi:hypothetical protein
MKNKGVLDVLKLFLAVGLLLVGFISFQEAAQANLPLTLAGVYVIIILVVFWITKFKSPFAACFFIAFIYFLVQGFVFGLGTMEAYIIQKYPDAAISCINHYGFYGRFAGPRHCLVTNNISAEQEANRIIDADFLMVGVPMLIAGGAVVVSNIRKNRKNRLLKIDTY